MQARAPHAPRSDGCECGATLRHVPAWGSSHEVSVRPVLTSWAAMLHERNCDAAQMDCDAAQINVDDH